MNKNILQFPLIALLYDELPDDEKTKVEKMIDDNPFLKAEYEELKMMKNMLNHMNIIPSSSSVQRVIDKLGIKKSEEIKS